ncbi:hypothetical protein QLT00_gp11 [Gordonia phage Commandaria]|uniref:Uncharacterized protein n=1 Tax=Gordonia phage Commandaria TaxID=3038364 RepID=A0AAF0GJA6_9CAUD|nr:hypothetical protein QLT00_gp11 [Gordonia phage Commandaria]WGH20794.1 hypothetical protein [Gordonia phage Commandaria]
MSGEFKDLTNDELVALIAKLQAFEPEDRTSVYDRLVAEWDRREQTATYGEAIATMLYRSGLSPAVNADVRNKALRWLVEHPDLEAMRVAILAWYETKEKGR